MPGPGSGAIARYSLQSECLGEQFVNTVHLSHEGSVVGLDATLFAGQSDLLITWWHALASQMPNACTLKRITARTFGDPPTVHERDIPDTQVGRGGSPLPFQLAVVISWRSNYAGRSRRGRTYVGPLATGAIDNSAKVPTAVADAFGNASVTLLNDLATGIGDIVDSSMVIRSTKLDDNVFVDHVLVGDLPDTQRRRRNRIHESYRRYNR